MILLRLAGLTLKAVSLGIILFCALGALSTFAVFLVFLFLFRQARRACR